MTSCNHKVCRYARQATHNWLYSLMLTWGMAQAICLSTVGSTRFAIRNDGTQVTDTRTGLVWARCSVGQNWNGSTCSGAYGTFSHEDASTYAHNQNGWRLPNVRELSGLTDPGCKEPAIDDAAFPNTPSVWYWTSTPYIGYSNYAWYVDFQYGSVNFSRRNGGFAVRLVRDRL